MLRKLIKRVRGRVAAVAEPGSIGETDGRSGRRGGRAHRSGASSTTQGGHPGQGVEHSSRRLSIVEAQI